MRLVAVPAYSDADIIFGAKNLSDQGRGATESFDFIDNLCQPGRYRFGLLQLSQPVVVSKAERSYPPLTLELTELKRLQGQGPDTLNEFLFGVRRNKIGSVAKTFGLRREVFKQGKLLGHSGIHIDTTDIGLQGARRKAFAVVAGAKRTIWDDGDAGIPPRKVSRHATSRVPAMEPVFRICFTPASGKLGTWQGRKYE